MTVGIIFLTLLVLAASSYFFTRQRSVALVSGELSVLHSLPGHYGWYAAVWTFMPGVVWVVLWVLFGSLAVDALVMGSLPDDLQPATPSQERLLLNDIHNIAAGDVASDAADPRLAEAAQRYNAWMGQGRLATFAIAVLFAALGMMRAFQTLRPDLRARNALERFLMVVLVICSAVAILTTLGIVLSLLFESLRFFARISPVDFLFGIHWSPQTALRDLCVRLKLDYDPGWEERWREYRAITGDPMARRGLRDIGDAPQGDISPKLIAAIEANEDYRRALELLGYRHPKG